MESKGNLMEMNDQSVASTGEIRSEQSSSAPPTGAVAIDCGVPETEQDATLMNAQTAPAQANPAQSDPASSDTVLTESASECFEPPADAEIPAELLRLLEQQFEGKTFGISGFDLNFKQAILRQVIAVKHILESEPAEAGGAATVLSVEQINNLIELCDCSGAPEKSSPYVQPLLIATVREDIGRSYLRGLQTRGRMLGTSYAMLTAPPPEPQALTDSAVDTAGLPL